jgi:hypothetical protein
MARPQRKFAHTLADQILSEYSSVISSENDSQNENFIPPGDVTYVQETKNFDWLERLVI